jgi:hypothetical protein
VDYLYALYDALVSIHVPNDKARAVVDAMERDMGTTLATKSDLNRLGAEVRQEIALVRKDLEILAGSVRGEIAGVRGEIAGVRKDLEVLSTGLRKEMDVLAGGFRKDLDLLSTTMTVRLGSMLVVGFGLTIAALKVLQA